MVSHAVFYTPIKIQGSPNPCAVSGKEFNLFSIFSISKSISTATRAKFIFCGSVNCHRLKAGAGK